MIGIIEKYLQIGGSPEEKLEAIGTLLSSSPLAQKGIDEIRFVLEATGSPSSLIIDFTLARGLNYYTGIIFEAKAPATVKIGSIGGGGRYDDLTGLFGVPNVPGVGISFGVDRIYDVLEELALFPPAIEQGTRVLFFNLGKEESKKAHGLAQVVRSRGIAAELFHESSKMDKQFKYAEKKGIPFVAILGAQELAEGVVNIKDLRSGEQKRITLENLSDFSFI
jgi:histidyl-tRNA synthetase